MLACNRLRIDMGDGSPALDYRIEKDGVESRILEKSGDVNTTIEQPWERLTPEQLTSHVMTETVISIWLLRRMGVHRLIRACSQPSPRTGVQSVEHEQRTASQ